MTLADAATLAVGTAGQALFASRILLQWHASEKAGRPVVPRGYWEVSLAAAALVLLYGILRGNLVYLLSVLPGAVSSARNLMLRRPSSRSALAPWALLLIALSLLAVLFAPHRGTPFWAAMGIVGAVLWSGRVLVQWWISERAGKSLLPRSFWILSLLGGLILAAYAISLRDPVMIAGYGLGCVPYFRNLMLLRRARGATAG